MLEEIKMSIENSIRDTLNKEWREDEQRWMESMLVKKWREKGATWRRVADYAALMWPDRGYNSGNQIEGRDLCQEAATILGEDYREGVWE
jgi:hypothetical protein